MALTDEEKRERRRASRRKWAAENRDKDRLGIRGPDQKATSLRIYYGDVKPVPSPQGSISIST